MNKILLASALSLSVMSSASFAGVISYTDFHDLSNVQLNGTAQSLSPNADGILRLTNNTGQASSAFWLDPLNLSDNVSFSAMFSFRIYNNINGGADGLTFTLQPNSNTAGSAGGGLGYQGIANSMGIEFDTWDNGSDDRFNSNHVGINFNGSMNSSAFAAAPFWLEGGEVLTSWIDYDGVNNLLEVRLANDGARPINTLLSYNVNLSQVFGTTDLFVGFTAATGWAGSTHDILSFEFQDRYAPISVVGGPQAVPEPMSLAIFSLGLIGLGVAGRRKKS
jgi:hypothetical protein